MVPVNGFYEWVLKPKGVGRVKDQPATVRAAVGPLGAVQTASGPQELTPGKGFWFTLAGQPLYALAGLWDAWKGWLQSFAIITVPANPTMRPIHDQMPAILHPRDYAEWLDRGETERAPVHLLRSWPEETLEVRLASPLVGNVRNQYASLLDSL